MCLTLNNLLGARKEKVRIFWFHALETNNLIFCCCCFRRIFLEQSQTYIFKIYNYSNFKVNERFPVMHGGVFQIQFQSENWNFSSISFPFIFQTANRKRKKIGGKKNQFAYIVYSFKSTDIWKCIPRWLLTNHTESEVKRAGQTRSREGSEAAGLGGKGSKWGRN